MESPHRLWYASIVAIRRQPWTQCVCVILGYGKSLRLRSFRLEITCSVSLRLSHFIISRSATPSLTSPASIEYFLSAQSNGWLGGSTKSLSIASHIFMNDNIARRFAIPCPFTGKWKFVCHLFMVCMEELVRASFTLCLYYPSIRTANGKPYSLLFSVWIGAKSTFVLYIFFFFHSALFCPGPCSPHHLLIAIGHSSRYAKYGIYRLYGAVMPHFYGTSERNWTPQL